MTTTVYPSTTTRTAAADPWDAPYFGGAVYFQYRAPMTPTAQMPAPAPTPKRAGPTLSASQPQRVFATDPWDAPYFGGPVYLRFPAFVGAAANDARESTEAAPRSNEPVATYSDAPIAEAEVVAAHAAQRGRWGWLAGLFGRG